jgi:hypothetical protein
VLLYVSHIQLDGAAKTILGWLPLGATVALLIWDLWAWRWPLLHRLTHRPRIDGLWRVELRPTEASQIPPGGNKGPIPAFLVISQSFWSTHVRQLTIESPSRSRTSRWEERGDADVERLSFLYENDPLPEYRHRSNRHLGACVLEPATLVPTTMTGVYFTDRYTQGSMTITFVDRTRGYSSYSEAVDHAR